MNGYDSAFSFSTVYEFNFRIYCIIILCWQELHMTRVLRLVVVFYIVCQLFKLVPDVYETMFCRWELRVMTELLYTV
jgi:hypothetical protein